MVRVKMLYAWSVNMSNELEDIIITIDTREQNQKRIKSVESWGIAQGAIVEHSKLGLCDYRIMGTFRDHEINVGIEAKGLSDFCSCDYEDLKRKLFDSFEIFEEVALFIESANYSFLNEGFGKSTIINSAVRDGSANVCNLAVLEGCCSTLPAYGIHVRQLRSEAQFPYSIENLLTYCIHDHDIIKQDHKQYLRAYKHTLRSFMTSVQVKKAISSYPNLFWLCSASEESYKEVFGNKTGTQHYNFIRNPELVTEDWKNKHFNDGTDKITLPEVEVCDKIKNAIVDYLTAQSPHALTVDELCDHFNIAQGDEDKEAFLIYIKELAWEKKITNTVSGELTIIHKLQSHCDPTGTFLNTNHNTTPLKPIHPVDDNDKTTGVLTPPLTLSPVAIPIKKECNFADSKKYDECKTKDHFKIKKDIVQENDLKLASSSILPKSSPAITPDKFQQPDMDLFGKTNPDWKVETHRMSARIQLESYLQNPHTLQECVDKFDMFTSGTVFEHIARMKKEGVIIEFDDKTLVMAK